MKRKKFSLGQVLSVILPFTVVSSGEVGEILSFLGGENIQGIMHTEYLQEKYCPILLKQFPQFGIEAFTKEVEIFYKKVESLFAQKTGNSRKDIEVDSKIDAFIADWMNKQTAEYGNDFYVEAA